jgi:predicted secreted protein
MNWFSGVLVYVMIWWVVLFTVLPWGIKVPEEPEPGHATSAPDKPRLGRKFLITTVIATVLWGVAYALIESELITFRVT